MGAFGGGGGGGVPGEEEGRGGDVDTFGGDAGGHGEGLVGGDVGWSPVDEVKVGGNQVGIYRYRGRLNMASRSCIRRHRS